MDTVAWLGLPISTPGGLPSAGERLDALNKGVLLDRENDRLAELAGAEGDQPVMLVNRRPGWRCA